MQVGKTKDQGLYNKPPGPSTIQYNRNKSVYRRPMKINCAKFEVRKVAVLKMQSSGMSDQVLYRQTLRKVRNKKAQYSFETSGGITTTT